VSINQKRSILNYFVWYKVSILFLISITLVRSSLYPSPSGFSSNDTSVTKWGEYGSESGQMMFPSGIALDQEGNVYVADLRWIKIANCYCISWLKRYVGS
jgi:Beta-propeller repeat